jgi:hypothetical protein
MTSNISLLGFAVVFASAWPTEISAQAGRPVSASDLSGKTICWSDGMRSTYADSGRYTNNKGAHTRWSVPEPGIVHVGSSERQTSVLADGQLHISLMGRGGVQLEFWGTTYN